MGSLLKLCNDALQLEVGEDADHVRHYAMMDLRRLCSAVFIMLSMK